MSSSEQSGRKRDEGGHHAHVRAPFTPQRHRDGGPDHGESPYPLGTRAFDLGAVLVVVPTALLWWFRTTRSRVAFAGYLLMNLWIVVGFGLIKGLWKSTLPVFLGTLLASVSTSFPRPTLGPVPFELSGIVTFIGSLFVLYYGYRLVRANRDAVAGAAPGKPTARRPVLLAASALVAFAVIAGAYAFTDKD